MVAVERTREEPRPLKIYEWLQKAALAGNTLARFQLGLLYYQGAITGVPDRAAAAQWLSAAAQACIAAAQYLLSN
jgi:TPR repeat protein